MSKKGKIIITLKSDLCAGSGYSYAGIIDSDICYDKYGIPYIPARRLKGCLRQSAEECLLGTVLCGNDIAAIFGEKGANGVKGIRIGNAVLREWDEIVSELSGVKSELVSSDSILKHFSNVRSQTRLVDGVADDNSLRYSRVVNHFSPLDNSEMKFVAEVSYDDSISDIGTKLGMIAKATRNIGLKRNRGLGSVICEFVEDKESNATEGTLAVTSGDVWKVIGYTIRNIEPLIIGGSADNESIKYIPGQAILGYMAGKYLNLTGMSSEEASNSDEFADLFLNGTTKYTNMVPSFGGKMFYPAPNYINRLKKTKKYVNVIDSESYKGEQYESGYDPRLGNQPKKLKEKFIYMSSDCAIDEMEVKTQVVYHNSIKGQTRSGDVGLLYSMEAIEPMQEFSGKIYTKEKYVPVIKGILENEEFVIGKSKTAQYGRCEVKDVTVNDTADVTEYKDSIVVTLLSDSIFLNENGEYTVYEDEVYGIIASQLGIADCIDSDITDRYPSVISSKAIRGYQTMWNLHKAAVPAVCAGSSFVYQLTKNVLIDREYIGERNIEGYGLVRIDELTKMRYVVEGIDGNFSADDENAKPIVLTRNILETILVDSIMNNLRFKATANGLLSGMSSAALGRVTLMLKESIAANSKPDIVKNDFWNRIESIKTKSTRDKAKEIYNKVTNLELDLTRDEELLGKYLELDDASILSLLTERWTEYAMTVLTLQKYEKSARKGE